MTGQGGALASLPLGLVWKTQVGPSISGGAVVAKGAVYVGDRKGTIHCLALADGRPRWTARARGGISATPLYLKDRIYIGDEEGWFHCLDAATGKRHWELETDGQIHSSANRLGDRVLFGSDDGWLRCCEPDGRVAWSVDTGDMVYNAPAVADGKVYLSGCAGVLSCHDGATGKELWSRDLGFHAPASPLTVGDRCLVATMKGRLHCFSTDGKMEHWTHAAPDASFSTSPATAGGVVVVGSDRDRTLYAVSLAKGERLWQRRARGAFKSPPAVAGKVVVVGAGDGKLRFIDLRSGKVLHAFLVGRGVEASPALAGSRVVFGDLGGTLWCLGPRRATGAKPPTVRKGD